MLSEQTRRWQELDARHHFHPFTTHKELAEKGARIITRAEGCYVWDSEGHKILDGMAGLWCTQIGHGRERLARIAHDQIRQLDYYNAFFQCATPPAVELAAKLAQLLPPGMDRFHFVNSGSEANDTVIKSVWYYWNLMGKPEKKHFISRTLGYHGVGVGSASLTGMRFMHEPFDLPLPRFHHIGNPYPWIEGRGKDPAAFGLEAARWLEEKILELGPENVAAFVAEPIQGAGGVIIPPETYWPEVQRICRQYDVLLVSDEVICGFGRTGSWWGHETMGFEPDIVSMAKGLSSGYVPIAAVAFGRRVGDVIFAGEKEYAHGVTYAGHPVCAAIALENIRIMEEEGLGTRASGPIGAYFRERLTTLADHPLVGEVRTKGLLACVELCKDKATGELFQPVGKVGLVCRDLCVENGLVMRAIRDGMVLSPPLIVTEEQIDEIVTKARTSLDQTLAAIGRA
ncbi:aspartate aminotransferase family protein [Benzoatithermus flavus]|uniref:Aspartate aminotransferase family protein n=1 Tax=Benzoatithermus flavus TaxID=3108223 RepID=A0ABU8XTJ2_9PROT